MNTDSHRPSLEIDLNSNIQKSNPPEATINLDAENPQSKGLKIHN